MSTECSPQPASITYRPALRRRLILALLLAGTIAAIIASAFMLVQLYHDERALTVHRLDEIERTLVPSLEDGVWQVDGARVDLLLNALIQTPGVTAVIVRPTDGEPMVRGNPGEDVLLERHYPLTFSGAGDSYALGDLEVQAGRQHILDRLRSRGLALATTVLFTVGAMGFVVLIVFRLWVTRHLQVMARQASAFSTERFDSALRLPDKRRSSPPDELDTLVDALNAMRERLVGELTLRARHESELEAYSAQLERKVAERTKALQVTNQTLLQQQEMLQQLVDTDALTGVASRRQTLALASSALKMAQRSAKRPSVLMLDIDHFKQVNDQHGHASGDAVLRAIAQCCREQLREGDVIGRMGGEEFMILLPAADHSTTAAVAERLRTAIAARHVHGEADVDIRVTVSIGIARAMDGETLESLMQRADQALYSAKRGGRNRVCVDGNTPST
ncbi:MAG: hypothetical protein CVV18_07325 [Gammaproteobacteria bacterium HGW-Gammaproteobacteria-8]|jgi:diguanylate cyclase (GGDEF)-like protein|nr:MAG: hypothetical protein CVV18_07325 [Gammaproteobacteria bacterium HGW-Gammaproteobacteria-8]PKM16431.1 MAG: hypothetical protein CVV12_03080 [Gammaproteobacteria bacterium HGW-Gammaproteobacteria-2]